MMMARSGRDGWARTREGVQRQLRAMNSPLYEAGLFRPATGDGQPEMLPRTWDEKTLLDSLSWLRWQNSKGRNIYVRPAGEHHLSLVDDLTAEAINRMKQEGYAPTVIVETSPGNFQAWLNHGEALPKDVSTVAARALAQRFGGDRGAADWRHFGRLAGFTNRKEKYRHPDGLFPFVHLIESRQLVYPRAGEFVQSVRDHLTRDANEREHMRKCIQWIGRRSFGNAPLTINGFRNNAKYNGDGNRIDLAYAVYAFSHGVAENEIRNAIASRDLKKKGSERRQQDYVRRTLEKARSIAIAPGHSSGISL